MAKCIKSHDLINGKARRHAMKYWYKLMILDKLNLNRMVFNGYMKATGEVEIKKILSWLDQRLVRLGLKGRFSATAVPWTWTRDSGEKAGMGASGVSGFYDETYRRIDNRKFIEYLTSKARMVVPKVVCEVSDASGFAWFVDVDGDLNCKQHD